MKSKRSKLDGKSCPLFVHSKMDRKYYFLYNRSNYGFYETFEEGQKRWWPSVTHYLVSKKFEGTQFEEVIRKTSTPRKAQKLARERIVFFSSDDCFEKRKIYGTKENACTPRSDWKKVESKYLYEAHRNKFKTYPHLKKLFIATHPQIIESLDDKNQTGKVLMKLRSDFRKNTVQDDLKNDLNEDASKNIAFAKIRALLMNLSLYISKMEGLKGKVLPEMVDDAISNIHPKVSNSYQKWYQLNASKNLAEHVNLNAYIKDTRKLFMNLDPYQKNVDTPSIKIGMFVLWCHHHNTTLKKYLKKFRKESGRFKRLNQVHPPIKIPHGSRWYRK
jgi:predicted NAD-dependent protein-ADP-ribosyltransferase YbiA (DUF1768 family)